MTSTRIIPPCRLALAAGLALALFVPGVALAQRGAVTSKNSPKFLAAFQPAVARAAESTVRIRSDGKDVGLGAVVAADGLVITKASELTDKTKVKLRDGRELDAELVGKDDKHDVALLRVAATGLKPVEWRPSKDTPVGNWVVTVGGDGKPAAVGVVSVGTRDVPTGKGSGFFTPPPGGGFLGVSLEPSEKEAKVASVDRSGGAWKAGLRPNDIILNVAGKMVSDADTLVGVLSKYKPGDEVSLKVKRGEEELDLKAKLGKRPTSRGDFQNSLGSELSKRRGGFPTILQHDTVVRPGDCGGPLVDLDGKVIGLNICRAGRTESYAVPSEVLIPLIQTLKTSKQASTGP
jgi:serine protease Do